MVAAPFVVSERRGLPRSALPGTRDEARRIAANRLAEDRASMSETISFQDADGKRISGRFDVSHGMITVTARDGRTKTADIKESMLSPETLARMLLLQLHQERRRAG